MKKSHLDFGIGFCSVAIIMILAVMLSGCGVKQPGSRTLGFGPDGVTVTSETTELPADQLVETEKEKTRQVCYKQLAGKKAKIEQLAEAQPLVYALIAQTETINNAMSLAITKKAYDPCPSSTNSSDVAIADDAMYTRIYDGLFKFAGTAAMTWGAIEISSDLFGALAKAGSTQLINSGTGDLTISDAYKDVSLAPGATSGGIFNNQTAEPFVFEIPAVQ